MVCTEHDCIHSWNLYCWVKYNVLSPHKCLFWRALHSMWQHCISACYSQASSLYENNHPCFSFEEVGKAPSCVSVDHFTLVCRPQCKALCCCDLPRHVHRAWPVSFQNDELAQTGVAGAGEELLQGPAWTLASLILPFRTGLGLQRSGFTERFHWTVSCMKGRRQLSGRVCAFLFCVRLRHQGCACVSGGDRLAQAGACLASPRSSMGSLWSANARLSLQITPLSAPLLCQYSADASRAATKTVSHL